MATDVKPADTSRAARGLITKTEYNAQATQGAMHQGHVTRSPTARRTPVPLDRSLTSPPPSDLTYLTNGARTGLVTQSFVRCHRLPAGWQRGREPDEKSTQRDQQRRVPNKWHFVRLAAVSRPWPAIVGRSFQLSII